MAVTQRPSWILRAAWAGAASCLLGAGLATWNYAALPGAERLPWDSMALVIVAYAVGSGIAGALGIAAATALAVRTGGGSRRVGALRMTAFGALGGLVGALVPAVVGIVGFGSLHAPYAGTANLVFSILVGSTTFVTLWAPQLWDRPFRLGRVEHLGVSAMAASLAIASFGILGASASGAFGFAPSFEWLCAAEAELGLMELAVRIGAVIGLFVGAAAGFACWLYLCAALVIERRVR